MLPSICQAGRSVLEQRLAAHPPETTLALQKVLQLEAVSLDERSVTYGCLNCSWNQFLAQELHDVQSLLHADTPPQMNEALLDAIEVT